MSGKKQVFATSPEIAPTPPMKSPYSGVKGWMGVGCDGGHEWVFIGFTTSPNLVKTEIHEGYNEIHTRIKWDDSIREEELTQTWGGSFLQFSNRKSAIQTFWLPKGLLELDWSAKTERIVPHGRRSDAIRLMRDQCKSAPQDKRAESQSQRPERHWVKLGHRSRWELLFISGGYIYTPPTTVRGYRYIRLK
jgi:hypothetical protein